MRTPELELAGRIIESELEGSEFLEELLNSLYTWRWRIRHPNDVIFLLFCRGV